MQWGKAIPLDESDQNLLFKLVQSQNIPPGLASQLKTIMAAASGIDFASGVKALEILERFVSNSRDAAIQTVRDKIAPSFYYRYLIINRPTLAKYDGYGFYHRKVTRSLINTDNTTKNWKLTFKGGFNQKLVLFSNSPSFVTYADLMFLCQVPRAMEEAKQQYDERDIINVPELSSDIKNPYPITDNRGKIRVTSFVRYFDTELIISNDSKNYKTYVRVYVCQMKNMKNCNQRLNLTIDELLVEMNDELIDPLRRSLRQTEILHPLPLDEAEETFAKEMYISTSASILDFQSIQENINILSTIDLTLKPSDKGTIHITHNMTKGINIVELSRYAENMDCSKESVLNCKNTRACATTFFIMEVIGSYGAEIVNKKDDEDRKTGTAPFQIRLRQKLSVTFKKNIKDPMRGGDIPYFDVDMDETNEMISNDYENQFQTRKGTDFNIDFKDLDIDGNKPKAKYNLSVDATSMLTNFGDIARTALNNPYMDDKEAEKYRSKSGENVVKLPKQTKPVNMTFDDVVNDLSEDNDIDIDGEEYDR